MDAIRLAGMRFFAVIGDLPHEREHPQPLEIDLEVRGRVTRAGRTDRLEDAIDYRELYETVGRAVERGSTDAPRLLEALCERIAADVLTIERVETVRVRCRKPWATLPGPVDRVEVEIERS